MSRVSRKHLLTALAAVSICTSLFSQNEEDALRISSIMPGGTARSAGMANAFGALGADGSSISINPAGFGVYRTSELSFTPSLEVNDATATYYGNRAMDTQARFNFSNLSLAINNPARNEGDWVGSTYGITFDRQATHHYRHQAIGERVPHSILHHFYQEATADPSADLTTDYPFTSTLAWETFGLDTMVGGILFPYIPFGADTRQTHTRETRGASNTTSFFYAGNYKDRLYIGASLGISGHRFRRVTTHSETNLDDDPLDINTLRYTETLNTTGNGFDVKIGVIGRITERFRMGASFHSPQWMRLNDAYVMEMTTTFREPVDGIFTYEAVSPDGVFNYRLNTPWKVVASAAYVAGPNGLFSLDYEYQDMRRMRFQPSSRIVDTYDFRQENNIIRDVFQPVHTVRVGTEWRTGAWYYRLGWGYSTDAYVSTDPRHGQAFRNYAAGIGYRTDHIGVDLGFNYNQRGTRYFTYGQNTIEGNEPVMADLTTYRTMLTVSFRP